MRVITYRALLKHAGLGENLWIIDDNGRVRRILWFDNSSFQPEGTAGFFIYWECHGFKLLNVEHP